MNEVAPQDPRDDLDAAALRYAAGVEQAPEQARQLREELTLTCLPFAARLARRYGGRGEPGEDLEQVARLGLVKAVDRYNPERGSFTAFAVATISGEIKRHFRDRTWGVHVPRRLQDLSLELGHATMVLTGTLARSPTAAELAAHVQVSQDAVLEALESAAGYTPASLNAPLGVDRGGEFGDLFGSADPDLELVDDAVTVSELLRRLPERERRMLALRFYGNRTQLQIADEFGISQMHVSRLLSRALSWLREAMLSDVLPRWEGAVDAFAETHAVEVSAMEQADGLTVRLRGEIDRDAAERLRRRLRGLVQAASAAGQPIRLELTAVPMVDAAGVGALLDVASAAQQSGVELTITGAQQYVAHILAISGLRSLLG